MLPRLFDKTVITCADRRPAGKLIAGEVGQVASLYIRQLEFVVHLTHFADISGKNESLDTTCNGLTALLNDLPVLQRIDITLNLSCIPRRHLQRILKSQGWTTFANIISLTPPDTLWKRRRVRTILILQTACSVSHFDADIWKHLLAVFNNRLIGSSGVNPDLEMACRPYKLLIRTRFRPGTTLKPLPMSVPALEITDHAATTLPVFKSHAIAWFPLLTALWLHADRASIEIDSQEMCYMPALRRLVITATAPKACDPFFRRFDTPRLAVMKWECQLGENYGDLMVVLGGKGSLRALLSRSPQLAHVQLALGCDLASWLALSAELSSLRSWLVSKKAGFAINYRSEIYQQSSSRIADILNASPCLKPAWECIMGATLNLHHLYLLQIGTRMENIKCSLLRSLRLNVPNEVTAQQTLTSLLQAFHMPVVAIIHLTYEGNDVLAYMKIVYDHLHRLPALEICTLTLTQKKVKLPAMTREYIALFRKRGVALSCTFRSKEWDVSLGWRGARCVRSASHV